MKDIDYITIHKYKYKKAKVILVFIEKFSYFAFSFNLVKMENNMR